MESGTIAVMISAVAAPLMGLFLYLAEVRVRWKAGAALAFAAALALLVAGGSPLAFVAGLSLQTLLAISLILYFKTGI